MAIEKTILFLYRRKGTRNIQALLDDNLEIFQNYLANQKNLPLQQESYLIDPSS